MIEIQNELSTARSVLTQQRDTLNKLVKILDRPEEERERSDLLQQSAQSRPRVKLREEQGQKEGSTINNARDDTDDEGQARERRGTCHDHLS